MKAHAKQTGSVVFYVIYFLLLAAALSAIVVGLGELWGFLRSYEASQIYHVTDEIAAALNGGDLSLLYEGVEGEISPYENEELLHKQLSERLTGEFTLAKNLKKSAKDAPVYTISCGGEPCAFASLKVTGKDPQYNLDIYSLDNVSGVYPETNVSVTVTLPTGCSARVNGMDILAGTPCAAAPIEEAENFGTRLSQQPEMLTYTINGLMYEPTVAVYAADGSALDVERSGGVYSCGLPMLNAAAAEEAQKFALEFSELYSCYIANDVYFTTVSRDIPEDTRLYSDLKTYEGQFYTYHTGYDFTDEQVTRVTQYSDECFAVRVGYKHNVYYAGETFTYPADNTVFAVNTADGWKAAALVMN